MKADVSLAKLGPASWLRPVVVKQSAIAQHMVGQVMIWQCRRETDYKALGMENFNFGVKITRTPHRCGQGSP